MAALGYLLVGSVSLGSARKAARAAKAETSGSERADSSPVLTERFLGHFGAGARKSGARKSASPQVRKSAAKKAGAGKGSRTFVGKKSTSKKTAGASAKR